MLYKNLFYTILSENIILKLIKKLSQRLWNMFIIETDSDDCDISKKTSSTLRTK